MKRYILLLPLLAALAACSSDDDNYDVTLYGDAAITSFAITGARVAVNDTTWQQLSTSFLSKYKFAIDQQAGTITNIDSLPYGTNAHRLLCTWNAKNNGTVRIEDGMETKYLGTADSTDFSYPRTLRVYSSDAQQMRLYTLTVLVRQEIENQPGTMLEEAAESPAPDTDGMSLDGIRQVVGRCTAEVHAINDDGLMAVSRDGGQTWTADVVLDSPDMLPTDGLAYNAQTFAYQDSTDYAVLAGTRQDVPYTIVWRKICDYSQTAKDGQWAMMSDADSQKLLPRLESLRLLAYRGTLLAQGQKDGEELLYQSRDGGITWKHIKP